MATSFGGGPWSYSDTSEAVIVTRYCERMRAVSGDTSGIYRKENVCR
jgi:hypothetical protein